MYYGINDFSIHYKNLNAFIHMKIFMNVHYHVLNN